MGCLNEALALKKASHLTPKKVHLRELFEQDPHHFAGICEAGEGVFAGVLAGVPEGAVPAAGAVLAGAGAPSVTAGLSAPDAGMLSATPAGLVAARSSKLPLLAGRMLPK